MNIDIQHFKTKLEEEKRTLEASLKDIGTEDPEQGDVWSAEQKGLNDDEPSDRTETAENITEFEENSQLVSTIETDLKDINAALDRIEHSTYGTCEICNEPIEIKRLEALPSARTCIAHMSN